jgi:hypothetical protein
MDGQRTTKGQPNEAAAIRASRLLFSEMKQETESRNLQGGGKCQKIRLGAETPIQYGKLEPRNDIHTNLHTKDTHNKYTGNHSKIH